MVGVRNSKNFGPIDQMGSRKGHLAPRVTTIYPHLPQGGRCENSKNFGPIDQIGSRKGHLAPNSNSDGLKEIHRYSKNFGPIDQMGSRKGHLVPSVTTIYPYLPQGGRCKKFKELWSN